MKINRSQYLSSGFKMKAITHEKELAEPKDEVILGQNRVDDLGLMERPLKFMKSKYEPEPESKLSKVLSVALGTPFIGSGMAAFGLMARHVGGLHSGVAGEVIGGALASISGMAFFGLASRGQMPLSDVLSVGGAIGAGALWGEANILPAMATSTAILLPGSIKDVKNRNYVDTSIVPEN